MLPCDLLLLHGAAVVNEAILTGESVPQVKESVDERDSDDTLDVKGRHRTHVLNGGTEMIQHTAPTVWPERLPRPQSDGIVCSVLKNGFETKQGKLMRTILDTTERVSVESREAYVFIFVLLLFALVASYHVMEEGLKDPERNRYKLLLKCILILTSVVPPELPMELSLAVNYSLIDLIKKSIFCTEPFRIVAAGKVDVCCFDKTGTLTSNDLVVRGVAGLLRDDRREPVAIAKVDSLSEDAAVVLAGCHTLAQVEQSLVGDPIEKTAVDALRWEYDSRRQLWKNATGSMKIL